MARKDGEKGLPPLFKQGGNKNSGFNPAKTKSKNKEDGITGEQASIGQKGEYHI